MKIALPYRQDSIEVQIAEEQILAVLEPNTVEKCTDPIQAVKKAVGNLQKR